MVVSHARPHPTGKGSGKMLLIALCPLPGIVANHSDCSMTSRNLITEQCMAYDIEAAAEPSASFTAAEPSGSFTASFLNAIVIQL